MYLFELPNIFVAGSTRLYLNTLFHFGHYPYQSNWHWQHFNWIPQTCFEHSCTKQCMSLFETRFVAVLVALNFTSVAVFWTSVDLRLAISFLQPTTVKPMISIRNNWCFGDQNIFESNRICWIPNHFVESSKVDGTPFKSRVN